MKPSEVHVRPHKYGYSVHVSHPGVPVPDGPAMLYTDIEEAMAVARRLWMRRRSIDPGQSCRLVVDPMLGGDG